LKKYSDKNILKELSNFATSNEIVHYPKTSDNFLKFLI
ncbi:hypothetical protein, partial [uncultured Gammaproteobacteria bacterium]